MPRRQCNQARTHHMHQAVKQQGTNILKYHRGEVQMEPTRRKCSKTTIPWGSNELNVRGECMEALVRQGLKHQSTNVAGRQCTNAPAGQGAKELMQQRANLSQRRMP